MRYCFFLCFALSKALFVNAQYGEIASATITFEFPSKKVKGSIEGFESKSRIDWNNPSNSEFNGSVAVATLDTNNGLRNWSLRSSRYFNAKTYPKISFASHKVRKTGTTWIVMGDLTIKGTTKPFQIQFKETGNKLVGNGKLHSSDFGIKIKKNRKDNLVKVNFEFGLIR